MSRKSGQPALTEALDESVRRNVGKHVELLGQLVAVRSLAGTERPAQELVEERLRRLGFATSWLNVADDVEQAAGAGKPRRSTSGRAVLVGQRHGRSPTALVVNGHVDVVPPGEEASWQSPPFRLDERDGWLYGRGAGDMKGGIVMALLALEALAECAPGSLDASLTFTVALEEESSGNGTLASILQGVRGDVALLPEPTDLQVLVSGVGVLWCRLAVRGPGAHAGSGSRHINPVDLLFAVVQRLRRLEARFAALSPEASERGQVFTVNLGAVHAGDWPSSVPVLATADVRIGFPESLTPAAAEDYVRAAVAEEAEGDEWLLDNPPQLDFTGLRAEPHRLDPGHALVRVLREAHRSVHDAEAPVVHGSATSDARFYLNQAGMPVVCYGPRTKNIHGVDEAVELESMVAGARTLTRAIPAILTTEPGAFSMPPPVLPESGR